MQEPQDITASASPSPPLSSADSGLSVLVITLLKGIIYQENDPHLWSSLIKLQMRVRDHVAVMGLELIMDEAENYAFLRSRPAAFAEEGVVPVELPRLVARRALTFPVSLLLALLRKKLAEFDARGGDTRLILSREAILDMVRVFLPEGTNETRLVNQLDANLNKIVELGFLRKLKTQSPRSSDDSFEVRRILKAFVDAQWLAEFDARLAQYQAHLSSFAGEDANE
jgi:hypothetical protein